MNSSALVLLCLLVSSAAAELVVKADDSATATASVTGTASRTASNSPSSSQTPTNSPSSSETPTNSASGTPSNTASSSETPSETASTSPSGTPTTSASSSDSSTPSGTASPSTSPSATALGDISTDSRVEGFIGFPVDAVAVNTSAAEVGAIVTTAVAQATSVSAHFVTGVHVVKGASFNTTFTLVTPSGRTAEGINALLSNSTVVDTSLQAAGVDTSKGVVNRVDAVVSSSSPSPSPVPGPKKKNTKVIVGGIIGGLAALALIALFISWRRRQVKFGQGDLLGDDRKGRSTLGQP